MKKYSCSTVLQKEAATRPDPARQPPNMMIGRLPKRFTRMLLIGPEEEAEKSSDSVKVYSLKRAEVGEIKAENKHWR